MQNFDYMTPTRLIFGKGVVEKLPSVMAQFGKKILLTYGGGSIKKIGLYQKVVELLKGYEIVELSGIQPNPKYDPSVLDGVRLCKEHKVDVILAVGGGSVLDCSKAIAAGACYDGDPWDLITYKVKAKAALPIVDIITLAATGSEYDAGGVISRTDTNDKIGYIDRLLYPRVSFLDHRAVLCRRHYLAERRFLRVDVAQPNGQRPTLSGEPRGLYRPRRNDAGLHLWVQQHPFTRQQP